MLLPISLCIGLALAAVLNVTLVLWDSALGWLATVGIAFGGFLACVILFVLFAVMVSLFIRTDRPIKTRSRFLCAITITFLRAYLQVMRVKVKAKNMDRIPKEGRFLLVANHLSMVDPMILMVLLRRRDLVFVSKKENISIPFGGKYIHAYGSIALDRSSLRSAILMIREATTALKEDRFSVGIYPEGERNKTQEPLLPFKEGAFSIAQRAGVPIVVCVFKGLRELKKNKFLRTTHVEVEFLETVDAETVKQNRPNVICDQVYGQMYYALTGKEAPQVSKEEE